MKRIVLLFVALLIANIANAQWQIAKVAADDLLGNEGYYMNMFAGENGGSFAFGSNTPTVVMIMTKGGIFNYNFDDRNSVKVTIGFYEGTELVDKTISKFYVINKGNANVASAIDQLTPGLAWKIINHLKTKGDVRIIADKYSGLDYDVRIQMNKDLKVDGLVEVEDNEIIVPQLNK